MDDADSEQHGRFDSVQFDYLAMSEDYLTMSETAYIYETYTDILDDSEINSIFKTLEAACVRAGKEFPQDKELIIGVRAES